MLSSDEILTAERMKAVYGDFWNASPKVRLSPKKVPEALHPLIPYAEFWGMTSEDSREELVDSGPRDLVMNMKAVVLSFQKTWEDWLTGPASNRRPLSPEYLAFTAMVMAADSAW